MDNGAEYWVRRAEANIGCRLERILGEDDIGFVDINFALSATNYYYSEVVRRNNFETTYDNRITSATYSVSSPVKRHFGYFNK